MTHSSTTHRTSAPLTFACAAAWLASAQLGCAAQTPAAAAPATPARVVRHDDDGAAVAAHGEALFMRAWTRGDARSREGDGLGPWFNGTSCVGCHNQGGAGGAGGIHGNTLLLGDTMVHRQGGDPSRFARAASPEDNIRVVALPGFAEVRGGLDQDVVAELLDMHRAHVSTCLEGMRLSGPHRGFRFKEWSVTLTFTPEGDVREAPGVKGLADAKRAACVAQALKEVTMPKASAPTRVTWRLTAAEVSGTPASMGQRNPSAVFGMGLIDTIREEAIVARAAVADPRHPEITGSVGRTADDKIARFGWKGDVDTLATFVQRACALEVGLEVPGVPQAGGGEARPQALDLNADDVHALTTFVRALPRPAVATESKSAARGKKVFASVGCTACHAEELGGVDGLYSDLLLHDMGAVLADGGGYGGGAVAAKDREWRTPPLWGVRDSGPWMHDGRAQTLLDAIKSHGGEAAVVRASFASLTADDKDAVVAFLESLQAPRL